MGKRSEIYVKFCLVVVFFIDLDLIVRFIEASKEVRFMEKGITIYPGLDNSPEENLQLMENAANCGIRRVFFSLMLPYADLRRAKKELGGLLSCAKKLRMNVVAALTPDVMHTLHITHLRLEAFRLMGIQTLFLKNFLPQDLAELSRNPYGIHIQFSASRMATEDIHRLLKECPNLCQLEALHNGYDREGTGMSEENLIRRTVMLHRSGIRVSAFIPGARRRSPFHAGIPSMEMHRHMAADLACRHYAAIGMDSIFFADSMPTPEELRALGSLSPKVIGLRASFTTRDQVQKDLLRHSFTARIDEARDAVRAMEGIDLLASMGQKVLPENTIARHVGDITIDNENCPGFMGEVQIIKRPSPASDRTNVAARIHGEEAFLINYVIPGKKFHFLFD